MKYNLKYFQFNERSILIEWPPIIDDNVLFDVLNFKNKLLHKYIKVKVNIINTYNSILINYGLTIEDVYGKFSELKSIYSELEEHSLVKQKIWEVPVCYDDCFGIDLVTLSKEKKLPVAEIVQRHYLQIYTVYFIGFLPGFLYLGGLDESLHFNRKSSPNLNIKKGAVGIGGNQTGIYPQNSPGGWHIIGNSPINFFDIKKDNPCFAKAGDKIKFLPVSMEEYISISKDIESKTYNLKSLLIE
ncbi:MULTISPECIES: 5-oxoprolinase subunit PxpB [unclassified Winogradskyella]|uniref:5-oxoprolinase subunit PxpB n=1 Tax=unclassified Winogradskyella TaxID=2615021 RepID=UPI000B3BFC8A|nr:MULTISPECIES: 5-oxoprolinase subunit PxpB [unclassified Winogradskyella]